MKWTDEQIENLRALAFAEIPNGTIAAQLEVPVSDVYAKRSQLNITVEKVKLAKYGIAPNPAFENAFPASAFPEQKPTKPTGLPESVCDAFLKLSRTLFLAIAQDDTSDTDEVLYIRLFDELRELYKKYDAALKVKNHAGH